MQNGIPHSDNSAHSTCRDIHTVTPTNNRIWSSNFWIHKISSSFKCHREENAKAEKAAKLGGVAYLVKVKDMIYFSIGLLKHAVSSVILRNQQILTL